MAAIPYADFVPFLDASDSAFIEHASSRVGIIGDAFVAIVANGDSGRAFGTRAGVGFTATLSVVSMVATWTITPTLGTVNDAEVSVLLETMRSDINAP